MARALRYKCIGYGVMVLLCYILQTAADSPLRAFGQTPDLLLLLTIAVAFREREIFAGYFGLICGFLSDAVTAGSVGFRAVFFMFLAFFLSIALQLFFRPLFLSFLVTALGVLTVSAGLEYLFFILLGGEIGFVQALVNNILPKILLGGVYSYIIYYIVYRYNLTLKRRGILQ